MYKKNQTYLFGIFLPRAQEDSVFGEREREREALLNKKVERDTVKLFEEDTWTLDAFIDITVIFICISYKLEPKILPI